MQQENLRASLPYLIVAERHSTPDLVRSREVGNVVTVAPSLARLLSAKEGPRV
jgi:hypothetical protein